MRKILMVTVLAIFSNNYQIKAQVTDSFSDGNFDLNPAWDGDTGQFIINNGELQLFSSGTDSSYLSVPWIRNDLKGSEWNFKIRMPFAPSSSNYSRFYLASDQQNLEGPVNGYYLQLGESGSNDAIELFRQDAWANVSVCRCTTLIASGADVRIRVTVDSLLTWNIFTDYSGGLNTSIEAWGIDGMHPSSQYCGFKCVYTSGNAQKFFLDDVYAGPIIYDTVPPAIVSFAIVDSVSADLKFSEEIETQSAQNISNYMLSSGNNCVSASRDSTDHTLVHLGFANEFSAGQDCIISVSGVADISGNVAGLLSYNFMFINEGIVTAGDILFSEIMADPDGAPSLPDVEYIELINRSKKFLITNGLVITDGSSTANLPADTLSPGDYHVYCSTASLNLLQNLISNVTGITSFPSLNNDADHLLLLNGSQIVDQVNYTQAWYRDDLRKNGGWSLERIDTSFTCNDALNWKASSDQRGGSPGEVNSTNGHFSDESPISVEYIEVVDSMQIIIHFSEPPDTSVLQHPEWFTVDHGIGSPISVFLTAEHNGIVMQPAMPVNRNEIYTLSVNSLLSDCAGNSFVSDHALVFGIPAYPDSGDVILNEILFNPVSGGSDYVELLNLSDHIIDLSQLKIASADITTQQILTVEPVTEEKRCLLPKAYLAITPDKLFITNHYFTSAKDILNGTLPSFNDDEGAVVLLKNDLEECDRFVYSDKMHFSLLNSTEGVALERVDPKVAASVPGNWHSASQSCGFGTPGKKNSQEYFQDSTGSLLSVQPELFSPDNDGEKDLLHLRLHTDHPGYLISIDIFNSDGIKIKSITSNELSGAENNWSWDGTDDAGQMLQAGIYITHLRILNPSGGVQYVNKPCVMAFRR